MLTWIILIVLAIALAVLAAMHVSYRAAMAAAERALADLEQRSTPANRQFDPAMLGGLPEVAQRYFAHAMAPGTPLATSVRLEMDGVFLLGTPARHQTFSMRARQVLAPPSEFVWIARMASGFMRIAGSDALVRGRGWTRFWLNGLVPVANQQTSPDLVRSALSRSAMEAIWVPATLLPDHGVTWQQTGPDSARLTFATGIEPVDLTLDASGQVVEIVTMRWSNENPERVFRLQPFGGRIEAEATFGGFTVPSTVAMGNHFGTPDYLPFFQGTIRSAMYR